jgi:hypothetical protein
VESILFKWQQNVVIENNNGIESLQSKDFFCVDSNKRLLSTVPTLKYKYFLQSMHHLENAGFFFFYSPFFVFQFFLSFSLFLFNFLLPFFFNFFFCAGLIGFHLYSTLICLKLTSLVVVACII